MELESDKTKFLQPEMVAVLNSMSLRARMIVEGYIIGHHRSPYHGFSVEFAEHRLYNSGESTKHIDWKLFARSDKMFVTVLQKHFN